MWVSVYTAQQTREQKRNRRYMFLTLKLALFAKDILPTPGTWSRAGWANGPPSMIIPVNLFLPCLPFEPTQTPCEVWNGVLRACRSISGNCFIKSATACLSKTMSPSALTRWPSYHPVCRDVLSTISCWYYKMQHGEQPITSPLWNVLSAFSPRPNFVPKSATQ